MVFFSLRVQRFGHFSAVDARRRPFLSCRRAGKRPPQCVVILFAGLPRRHGRDQFLCHPQPAARPKEANGDPPTQQQELFLPDCCEFLSTLICCFRQRLDGFQKMRKEILEARGWKIAVVTESNWSDDIAKHVTIFSKAVNDVVDGTFPK